MNTNECKVKIGISYEPKWFEKRQTNGWYSGKNPPLDNDAMAFQSCLLGTGVARFWKTKVLLSVVSSVVVIYFSYIYGVFK